MPLAVNERQQELKYQCCVLCAWRLLKFEVLNHSTNSSAPYVDRMVLG
jgi:hypothetical protein